MPGSIENAWPGTSGSGVAGDDVRILMGLDADAVTGAMDEEVAVAVLGDDASADGIDVFARSPDDSRVDRRGLCALQDRVQLDELVRRLTDVDAPSDVAAVADAVVTDHRAPEVAQDDLAFLDHVIAGIVVRAGGVGAGGDDGEVHPVMPFGEDAPAQIGRHLGLGAADQCDVALL